MKISCENIVRCARMVVVNYKMCTSSFITADGITHGRRSKRKPHIGAEISSQMKNQQNRTREKERKLANGDSVALNPESATGALCMDLVFCTNFSHLFSNNHGNADDGREKYKKMK